MLQLILDPLQHAFMQRGLLAAALVGIVCALIGTYVVLRGMAFFGESFVSGSGGGCLFAGNQSVPVVARFPFR